MLEALAGAASVWLNSHTPSTSAVLLGLICCLLITALAFCLGLSWGVILGYWIGSGQFQPGRLLQAVLAGQVAAPREAVRLRYGRPRSD